MKNNNILKHPILYLICGFFLVVGFSSSEKINNTPEKIEPTPKEVKYIPKEARSVPGSCSFIFKQIRNFMINGSGKTTEETVEKLNYITKIYTTGSEAQIDSLLRAELKGALDDMTSRVNYCYSSSRFSLDSSKALDIPAATIIDDYNYRFNIVKEMVVRHFRGEARAPKRLLGKKVCILLVTIGAILDSYGEGVNTDSEETKTNFINVMINIA